MVGSYIAGAAATTLCGVFAVGAGGLGVPLCGIVLVGAGSAEGSIGIGAAGEKVGEMIYEVMDD